MQNQILKKMGVFQSYKTVQKSSIVNSINNGEAVNLVYNICKNTVKTIFRIIQMQKLRVSRFGLNETLYYIKLLLWQKIGKFLQSFIKKMDFFTPKKESLILLSIEYRQQTCYWSQTELENMQQADGQVKKDFFCFFYNVNHKTRMNKQNPTIKDVLVKQSQQLNQIAYVQLQQHPSIEFGVQFPTITKTQEQKSKNGLQIEDKQSKSIKSFSNNFHPQQKSLIPKSINHNFQKHTVVTIKKLTQNMASTFGIAPAQLIARQMWSIFLSSGIKSKRILVILFGRANLKDETYKNLLKSYFFGQLCNYDEQSVRQAQKILRERVVLSLDEGSVWQNIERNRHIQLREQFYAYFMQLVQNLKRAPLIKFRINSSTSKRIADRIKTTSTIHPPGKAERIKRNKKSNH